MKIITVFGLWLATLLLLPAAGASSLVISNIGGDLQQQVKALYPVAHRVVDQLNDQRFTQAQVHYTENILHLIDAVRIGEIHWVTESPYAAALLIHEANMLPILKRDKHGQHEYHSLLITLKQIPDLKELIGKKIAVEAKNSFSGYFLLYRHLVEQNLPIHTLSAPRETVHPQAINLVFSGSAELSSQWLAQGVVAGAVFDSGEYQSKQLLPDSIRQKTHILYRSENYPRAIELLSSSLPDNTKIRIKTLLMQLPDQPGGSELLEAYHQSSQFLPITAKDKRKLKEIYLFSRSPQNNSEKLSKNK